MKLFLAGSCNERLEIADLDNAFVSGSHFEKARYNYCAY